MGQIRHIAYRADNVEAMADFFLKGFGMTIEGRRQNGAIDLSDGVLNITLLRADAPNANGEHGISHIGFTVTDEAEARRLVEAAGGKEANTINMDPVHYEVKYEGPEGIVVDIGHWVGTAPVDEPASARAAP